MPPSRCLAAFVAAGLATVVDAADDTCAKYPGTKPCNSISFSAQQAIDEWARSGAGDDPESVKDLPCKPTSPYCCTSEGCNDRPLAPARDCGDDPNCIPVDPQFSGGGMPPPVIDGPVIGGPMIVTRPVLKPVLGGDPIVGDDPCTWGPQYSGNCMYWPDCEGSDFADMCELAEGCPKEEPEMMSPCDTTTDGCVYPSDPLCTWFCDGFEGDTMSWLQLCLGGGLRDELGASPSPFPFYPEVDPSPYPVMYTTTAVRGGPEIGTGRQVDPEMVMYKTTAAKGGGCVPCRSLLFGTTPHADCC